MRQGSTGFRPATKSLPSFSDLPSCSRRYAVSRIALPHVLRRLRGHHGRASRSNAPRHGRAGSVRAHAKSYTAAVVGLTKFYRRSPDQLTQREVEAYLVHLTEERKLAWNTRSLVTNGLRFFYHTTLGHKQMDF